MAVPDLSPRIYLDHNVQIRVAIDLRGDGFDVVVAGEIGKAKASDEEHLRYAASERRAIISHDLRDFPILADEWRRRNEFHAGIIVSRQSPPLSYGDLIGRLRSLLTWATADELFNRFIWLSDEVRQGNRLFS